MERAVDRLIEYIRAGIIGDDRAIEGPFGPRRMTYADYTASGRSLAFVEDFIRWDAAATYQVDAAVYTTSPDSLILNNSVLTHGRYPYGVEVRYSGATGVEVVGNLMDAVVRARDGASPSVSDNLTNAMPGWFVDETAGDLHLLPAATDAIDQIDRRPDCADDFDGSPRPSGAGAADIGADEYEAPLFVDGFESGDATAWSDAVGMV